MENNIIMFSSVTLAMRAKDVLSKNRINSKLIRTPVHLRNKSCGYSLIVNKDINIATEIISRNRIPYLGVSAVDII